MRRIGTCGPEFAYALAAAGSKAGGAAKPPCRGATPPFMACCDVIVAGTSGATAWTAAAVPAVAAWATVPAPVAAGTAATGVRAVFCARVPFFAGLNHARYTLALAEPQHG